MANVVRARGALGRRRGRQLLPFAYLLLALVVAVVLLPSALRPPPDPATTSGALDPNAPPDQQNADQILQSLGQAAGGGAGAGAASTTTTVAGAIVAGVAPTTLPPPRASSGTCFGHPARQIESVYSGPCVPAFHGPNGGATAKNVFPNEVALGFNHGSVNLPAGRVPSEPSSNENAATRTMRVLNQYVNSRFETYGRHVVFYGLPNSSNDADSQLAASATADATDHVFGAYDLGADACTDMARRGLVSICNPLLHGDYAAERPELFSWMMDLDEMAGFGAEYVCKQLKGKNAEFGGADQSGKVRKIGFISDRDASGGLPAKDFVSAYAHECGGVVVDPVELPSTKYTGDATTAIEKLRSDGVTTIVLDTGFSNTLAVQTTASSGGYGPEWVLLGNYGVDFNSIANLLPKDQTAHMFGLTGWELPRGPEESECVRAYKSIDPDNEPDGNTCGLFWYEIVTFLDGIQGAGPHLTPATFQTALYALGHRFGQTVWSIGGGYGPDDDSYVDSVSEIWWSSTATDPGSGDPGAFRWTHGGGRWQRGQLPTDASQLFEAGISGAPAGS